MDSLLAESLATAYDFLELPDRLVKRRIRIKAARNALDQVSDRHQQNPRFLLMRAYVEALSKNIRGA